MKRKNFIIGVTAFLIGALCVALFAEGKKYFKIPLEKCDGCGTCAAECPEGAISPTTHNGKKVFIIDPVKCNACGVCQSVCPPQIIMQDSADISKEKKSDAKSTGEGAKKEVKKGEKTNVKPAAADQSKEKKSQ